MNKFDTETCPTCEGLIAIRNPTGFCDHLYYPENKTTHAELITKLSAELALKRELVELLKRLFIKHKYGCPCENCALITRAEKTL